MSNTHETQPGLPVTPITPVTLATPHGALSHDGRHLTLAGVPLWRLTLTELERALKYALRKIREERPHRETLTLLVEAIVQAAKNANYSDQQAVCSEALELLKRETKFAVNYRLQRRKLISGLIIASNPYAALCPTPGLRHAAPGKRRLTSLMRDLTPGMPAHSRTNLANFQERVPLYRLMYRHSSDPEKSLRYADALHSQVEPFEARLDRADLAFQIGLFGDAPSLPERLAVRHQRLHRHRELMTDTLRMLGLIGRNLPDLELKFRTLAELHDLLAKHVADAQKTAPNRVTAHAGNPSWNGHFADLDFSVAASTDELVEIGGWMNHCVGSYGFAAVAGDCAIVTARDHGRPVVCIQLSENAGRTTAVQARGYGNAVPTPAQRTGLTLWAAACDVQLPASLFRKVSPADEQVQMAAEQAGHLWHEQQAALRAVAMLVPEIHTTAGTLLARTLIRLQRAFQALDPAGNSVIETPVGRVVLGDGHGPTCPAGFGRQKARYADTVGTWSGAKHGVALLTFLTPVLRHGRVIMSSRPLRVTHCATTTVDYATVPTQEIPMSLLRFTGPALDGSVRGAQFLSADGTFHSSDTVASLEVQAYLNAQLDLGLTLQEGRTLGDCLTAHLKAEIETRRADFRSSLQTSGPLLRPT